MSTERTARVFSYAEIVASGGEMWQSLFDGTSFALDLSNTESEQKKMALDIICEFDGIVTSRKWLRRVIGAWKYRDLVNCLSRARSHGYKHEIVESSDGLTIYFVPRETVVQIKSGS